MQSIKILVGEHKLILECLDQLSLAAKRIADNQPPPKEFFEEALDFCRIFSDKYHHWKEEYTMFGLLAQKHEGTLDAQIERHRNQHEHCRNLIRAISESLEGYSVQLNESSRKVHRNVIDYVETLRSHIRSENEVLFPMAEQALSDDEDERLMKEFKKYEEKIGSKIPDTYRKLVTRLAEML